MATKKKDKRCTCIAGVNETLEERNVVLDTTYNFTKGISYVRVPLVVLDKDVRPKTKIPTLLPKFCCFCGKPYPEST